MFTSSLNEEVKLLEEDIEAVKDKVDDPVICEKVRQFVYAPKEIQAIYKGDSGIFIPNQRHTLTLIRHPFQLERIYISSLQSFVPGRSQSSRVHRCSGLFNHIGHIRNT
jgi:Domain of unknown function in PX-proteins (DUF3818)